jgi:plasmid stabilization system protein ParE
MADADVTRTPITESGPMPKEWSDKRERQYEHIKESYKDRGVKTDEAEERAARTVNKERREEGETKAQRGDG